jgi:hypothetical protein
MYALSALKILVAISPLAPQGAATYYLLIYRYLYSCSSKASKLAYLLMRSFIFVLHSPSVVFSSCAPCKRNNNGFMQQRAYEALSY